MNRERRQAAANPSAASPSAATPIAVKQTATRWTRREWLAGTSMVLLPLSVFAAPVPIRDSLRDAFGDAEVREGRVTLSLPPLSENGNSVSLEVDVESTMQGDDFVRSIHIFSSVNPVPTIAAFHFGADAARARVATRIRLADTQRVVAAALTADGTVWTGAATTIVTLAACIDPV